MTWCKLKMQLHFLRILLRWTLILLMHIYWVVTAILMRWRNNVCVGELLLLWRVLRLHTRIEIWCKLLMPEAVICCCYKLIVGWRITNSHLHEGNKLHILLRLWLLAYKNPSLYALSICFLLKRPVNAVYKSWMVRLLYEPELVVWVIIVAYLMSHDCCGIEARDWYL